ncbi:hypothetical protein AGDE_12512 [Angomonas deanei]|uniref:Uncharacterized protein n=1 Tax=Angomonas deanei TaxID=59799 RepID=A0A7G2CDJ8_9TRYP|nr:hypothetical protein AGDE_12512 [Angomonas deanei]CAD2217101.1 hypothetical protein, conserved [Angomonas deanei]|eukprot:EPY24092.1 hypothetical protein AGDE_12512 [Angomonas deanei]
MSEKVAVPPPLPTRDLDPMFWLAADVDIRAGDKGTSGDSDYHGLMRHWRQMNEALSVSFQRDSRTVVCNPDSPDNSMIESTSTLASESEGNQTVGSSFIGERNTYSFAQKRYDGIPKSTARSRKILFDRARQVERKIEFNSLPVTPCHDRTPVTVSKHNVKTLSHADKKAESPSSQQKSFTRRSQGLSRNVVKTVTPLPCQHDDTLHSIAPSHVGGDTSSSDDDSLYHSVYGSTAVPLDDIEEQFTLLQAENQARVSIMMEYVREYTNLHNAFINSFISSVSVNQDDSQKENNNKTSYEEEEQKSSGLVLKPGKEKYIRHLMLLSESMENRVKTERFRENKMLLLSYYQRWRYQIAFNKLQRKE